MPYIIKSSVRCLLLDKTKKKKNQISICDQLHTNQMPFEADQKFEYQSTVKSSALLKIFLHAARLAQMSRTSVCTQSGRSRVDP